MELSLVTKLHLGDAIAFAAPAATRWTRPPKRGALFNSPYSARKKRRPFRTAVLL